MWSSVLNGFAELSCDLGLDGSVPGGLCRQSSRLKSPVFIPGAPWTDPSSVRKVSTLSPRSSSSMSDFFWNVLSESFLSDILCESFFFDSVDSLAFLALSLPDLMDSCFSRIC